MHALTLVSKNLSRRKARTVLSSIGLILAVAVIISTFTISNSMAMQVGDEIEKYGPNIVVTPNTQSVVVPYGNVIVGAVTIPENYIDKIYTIPNKQNLRVLAPKLYGQIQHENNSLLLVGVFFEREIQLKKWWNITGSLPENDTNQILIGSSIKQGLNLEIDSVLKLNDQTEFIVKGYLTETGSVDDYSIFAPLHAVQNAFNLNGKVSLIDVGATCKDCPVEVISQQIMDTLPDVKATPVKQAVETRMEAVEQTANFSLLLATIILAVGIAGIMNTILASVHERIREIGVFMSFGADNRLLYKMFLIESVILGVIGGTIGALTGILSSALLGPLLINVTINFAEIPLYLIPLAFLLSVGACLAASVYPAWRASKIDPVKALKTV